jgi:hypothetical protein
MVAVHQHHPNFSPEQLDTFGFVRHSSTNPSRRSNLPCLFIVAQRRAKAPFPAPRSQARLEDFMTDLRQTSHKDRQLIEYEAISRLFYFLNFSTLQLISFVPVVVSPLSPDSPFLPCRLNLPLTHTTPDTHYRRCCGTYIT